MSVCQFENTIKNFRDIDCGCLYAKHEYANVTVRIHFLIKISEFSILVIGQNRKFRNLGFFFPFKPRFF